MKSQAMGTLRQAKFRNGGIAESGLQTLVFADRGKVSEHLCVDRRTSRSISDLHDGSGLHSIHQHIVLPVIPPAGALEGSAHAGDRDNLACPGLLNEESGEKSST